MPTNVIVTRRFTVPANTTSYEIVYTVSPGARFKLKRVKVYFPAGTASELQVRILQGWTSIAPTAGEFTGDDMMFEHDVDAEYGSGSLVRAYIRNLNPTASRECIITLEGEE